jgi:hypothetical protein
MFPHLIAWGITQETRETGLEKEELNNSPDEKPANG